MNFYKDLNEDDRLKAENAFLQMKLVLETGVTFMDLENDNGYLPADIENQFLKSIITFDRRFEHAKTIPAKKTGEPAALSPSKDILDLEIDKAWSNLSRLMGRLGMQLDKCSL